MRVLALIASLAVAAAAWVATPNAQADAGPDAQAGGPAARPMRLAGIAAPVPGTGRVITGRTSGRGIASPVPRRYYRKERRGLARPGLGRPGFGRPPRPSLPIQKPRRRAPRDIVVFGYHDHYRDRLVIERRVAAPPKPRPPAPAPGRPALTPADAAGPGLRLPARSLAARSATRAVPALGPGAALPDGVPFVSLSWRSFALPRPPAGQLYARVGTGVYLIDPVRREVVSRILPE